MARIGERWQEGLGQEGGDTGSSRGGTLRRVLPVMRRRGTIRRVFYAIRIGQSEGATTRRRTEQDTLMRAMQGGPGTTTMERFVSTATYSGGLSEGKGSADTVIGRSSAKYLIANCGLNALKSEMECETK